MGDKKFELGGYQYDQETFIGRLRHQLNTTNPFYMFKSDKQIKSALDLLDQYKKDPENTLRSIGSTKLWEAQNLKTASIHPDTGEKVLLPLRLCGFVTFNIPICAGLIMPNQTAASLFLFQF